jgi:DNA invertase Pin-like site-specific DNA recombinase
MSKSAPQLISSLGYLRKSTKGDEIDRKGRRHQRQEKSIAQQKAEIEKLAAGQYRIVGWFADEGVSGWKRGARRPDFTRMLAEAQSHNAQAILCDNIDRFSRAAVDEVQEDVNALRKAGVRWIVTASHGEYDLGARFDIGAIIKFVAAAWSACEYSRQLSRRISLARRNKALEGKRSGGFAAYGLKSGKDGSLEPGDPAKRKNVQWLFDQFGNEHRSLNWMAGDLNRRKVPGPTGGRWQVRTIRLMLSRRCYMGDFTYGTDPQGQFYRLDEKGEVVERADVNGKGKVIEKRGLFKPVVDPVLFARCQRRLDALAKNRSLRKSTYALSGILVCDHCGSPMYGVPVHGNIVYRCSDTWRHGRGSCPQHGVRQDALLPFLLQTLGQEIQDIKKLAAKPPEELLSASSKRREKKEQTQKERDALAKRIDKATLARIESEDKRTRQDYDKLITGWRDELEKLDVELAGEPGRTFIVVDGNEMEIIDVFGTEMVVPIKEEIEALNAWWTEFEAKAVASDGVLIDPRKINQTLRELGAEVRLRWETRERTSKRGNTVISHELVRGRFRLGQQTGKLPEAVIGFRNLGRLMSL